LLDFSVTLCILYIYMGIVTFRYNSAANETFIIIQIQFSTGLMIFNTFYKGFQVEFMFKVLILLYTIETLQANRFYEI